MADEENKDPEQKKEKQPDPVPYSRFKEVNDELGRLKTQIDEIEKKKKQDADQKLADEKKWEDLAKQKDLDLKTKEAELLRLRVAAKKRVPVDLIDRLKGSTEAEIEADADILLGFLKEDEAPGIPPHKKGGSNTKFDLANMSPEEIRKNASAILSQGAQK